MGETKFVFLAKPELSLSSPPARARTLARCPFIPPPSRIHRRFNDLQYADVLNSNDVLFD